MAETSGSMRDADKNVVKIKVPLAAEPPKASTDSTLVDSLPQEQPRTLPVSGMPMEQLENNYQAILRTQAIFYPVVYQFLQELGRGRQGVVYLCLRQGARGCITKHAIKVFDPGIYKSPEEYWTDMGRLASQISRLQSLSSPNLVPIHSYEETYGIGYSQMEAIDGLDLRRLLGGDHIEFVKRKSTPEEWARFTRNLLCLEDGKVGLNPGVAVYILRRMVRGVERLHSVGFLHSDVKPANVMIDRLGTIRIVDFGRAVMIGEQVTFLFGTPLYMPPETHRREPGGPQSDFYSVGMVGLEMLRGEPICDPNTPEKDLLQLKMELPSRLGELFPPRVPKDGALARIIRRLLEPEPQDRYGSAKDADVGSDGLIVVDTQFTREGISTDSGRILADYLSKLVHPRSSRVEAPSRERISSEVRSEIIR